MAETTSGTNTGETIYGTAGADKLKGLGGDDTFYVYTGNDSVDGGAGSDTVVFSGTHLQYVITPQDTGNLKITVEGTSSTAEIKKVETLQFSDGSYDVASGVFTPDVAPLPVVSLTPAVVETTEGGTLTFTFTRTGDTASELTVNYSIVPALIDGATPGADFPAQTGTITFAAGSSTAVLSFDAIHDAVVESTEFFQVVLGAGAGYQVDLPNATANASIIDGTIIGTNDPDNLVGTNDPDAILGLAGGDELAGGLGDDYLDGGAGFDRAIYTNAAAAVSIQLAAGIATIGASVDTLRSIELARGTAHNDTFNATGFGVVGAANVSSESNPNFNAFEGLAGADNIIGNGSTRIEFTMAAAGVTVTFATGTSGSATGDASVGTDTFSGTFAVRASHHNDLIINAGTTNNTFDGQGGFDTVSYASAGAAINVNLQATAGANVTGGGGNDSLRDNLNNVTIEGIIGTNFNDTFTGNGTFNSFNGGGGADIAVLSGNLLSATIIDNVMGNATVITAGGGTDTYANVELLQFADAYQLTSAALNANLTGLMLNMNPTFGTGFNETITIGGNFNGRTLDLLGGTDTVLLGLSGAQNYNLALEGVEFLTGRNDANENVFLSAHVNGMIVDLGDGSDQLTLGDGPNVVTVVAVETIGGSSSNDTVTFVLNTGNVNQQIDLGSGTNVLNLEGTGTVYSLTLNNIAQVNGHAGFVHDILNVQNLQLGTTFDLGDGISDELHLGSAPAFPGGPDGMNFVTVYNTENVFGALAAGDNIQIGGNTGGNVTTVTAGLGPDQIWASNDSDHFRFTLTGDSANTLGFGAGQRDVITGFDASEDAFVFDHILGATSLSWVEINVGGTDIVLVDLNGGGTNDGMGNYFGYEMAIELDSQIGPLTNANFMLLV